MWPGLNSRLMHCHSFPLLFTTCCGSSSYFDPLTSWVFPKIMVYTRKPSYFNGLSMNKAIHFGAFLLFLETSSWCPENSRHSIPPISVSLGLFLQGRSLVLPRWRSIDVGHTPIITNTCFCKGPTLPETNSSHLKMDGWNTILSYWGGLFPGAMLVSARVSESKCSTVILNHMTDLWLLKLLAILKI